MGNSQTNYMFRQKNISDINIVDFPNEIILHILSFIPKEQLFVTVGLTCKRLYLICRELLDHKIEIYEFSDEYFDVIDSRLKSFPYVLAELSKCDELLSSISHLVIWWYPEDYIGLNTSIKQDFSKRTKYRKEICIEAVPTDIFGSDLVLLFKSDPGKRMIDSRNEGISQVEHRRNLLKILQFAKSCKNLKGLHWKETQSYHNINDTFDYLLKIVEAILDCF